MEIDQTALVPEAASESFVFVAVCDDPIVDAAEGTNDNIQSIDLDDDIGIIEEEETLYNCPWKRCDRVFSDALIFNSHLKSHAEKRKFPCEICGHKFTRKSDLTRHLRTGVHKQDKIVKTSTVVSGPPDEDASQTPESHSAETEIDKAVHDNKPCECSFCKVVEAGGRKVVDSQGRRLHVCDFENCGRSFNNAANLKIHLRTHTGERPYSCDFPNCGRSFVSNAEKERHKWVHTSDWSFDQAEKVKCQCPHCLAEKSGAGKVLGPEGRRLHNCHFAKCGKNFTKILNLKVHLAKHSKERSYSCKFLGCAKKFSKRAVFINHVRMHGKVVICDCPNCTEVHNKIFDSDGNQLHFCHVDNCGQVFVSQILLKQHLKVTHELNPFPCLWLGCSKRCPDRASLTQHMLVHTGEKNYVCNVCDYRSTRSADLSRHLKIHEASIDLDKMMTVIEPTKEPRPGVQERASKRVKDVCECPNCKREEADGTKTLDALGKRLHICHYENCGKFFDRLSNLKAHFSVHTKECLYSCQFPGCRKKFTHKGTLRRHSFRHNQHKNHACSLCGHRYFEKKDLDKHMQIHDLCQSMNSTGALEAARNEPDFPGEIKTEELDIECSDPETQLEPEDSQSVKRESKNPEQTEQTEVFKHQLQNLDQWWPKNFDSFDLQQSSDVRQDSDE